MKAAVMSLMEGAVMLVAGTVVALAGKVSAVVVVTVVDVVVAVLDIVVAVFDIVVTVLDIVVAVVDIVVAGTAVLLVVAIGSTLANCSTSVKYRNMHELCKLYLYYLAALHLELMRCFRQTLLVVLHCTIEHKLVYTIRIYSYKYVKLTIY